MITFFFLLSNLCDLKTIYYLMDNSVIARSGWLLRRGIYMTLVTLVMMIYRVCLLFTLIDIMVVDFPYQRMAKMVMLGLKTGSNCTEMVILSIMKAIIRQMLKTLFTCPPNVFPLKLDYKYVLCDNCLLLWII